MATKNIQVVHIWEQGDTGIAAEITATLTHYADNATKTTASETVTIVEIGTTGAYYITYTPTNAYPYRLRLVHDGGAAPTYSETWWEDDVRDAPDTATENYSYASEADVVSYAQMGDYTSSTNPTQAQVVGFLEQRSARVYAHISTLMGTAATGPSGYATTIDNTTDAGLALERATKRAAAIGAAADAIRAAGAGDSPGESTRVADLEQAFVNALADINQAAYQYLGWPVRSATHVSKGQVTRSASTTTPTEQGLPMTSELQF